MWHVWHAYAPFVPESKRAIERIGTFIKELFKIEETVKTRG